jgi:WD40 repeat protein
VPDGRLVSASADGTVKVWRLVAAGKWILSVSYDFGGVIPTCLGVCQADFGKVLVGLGNGVLKVWDVEEGSEVQSFGEATEGASTRGFQASLMEKGH